MVPQYREVEVGAGEGVVRHDAMALQFRGVEAHGEVEVGAGEGVVRHDAMALLFRGVEAHGEVEVGAGEDPDPRVRYPVKEITP